MEVQDWLERIYIGPGGVERSSRESDRGPNALSVVREAFLEVQERSGGPSEGPGGGEEALQKVREWSGGPT